MRRNTLYKIVACVLTLTQTFYPVVGSLNTAYAASPFKNEAKDLSNSVSDHVWSDASFDNGKIKIGDIDSELDDIFPGINNPEAAPPGSPSMDDLTDSSDSDIGMKQVGQGAKGNLHNDAQSGDPSVYGSAYGVFHNNSLNPRVDLTGDPIFDGIIETKENADIFEENFFSCEQNDVLVDTSRKGHIPDYKTCNRIQDMDVSCKVKHNYGVSFISHYGGPYNLAPCDSGDCIEMWIGEVGDNYWSGWCSIYEEYTQVMVDNPEAITKATLTYTKYDDYMQVLVGPPGEEELVWSGPDGNFPPETGGKCELSTSWESSPGIDLTSHLKNVDPGTVISFKIRVSVSGEGEGFGRISISYDKDKVVVDDIWEPDNCIHAIKALDDGYTTGSYTCVDDPGEGRGDGCAIVDGVPVCPDILTPAPSPNIPNTCRLVDVSATLDFWKGDMDCWVDPQGDEHCPTITDEFVSDCPDLEAQGCGFIEQECVEGSRGPSGTCYVTEEVWDCGHDVDIESGAIETEYVCDGDFQCIGPDCFDTSVEHNTDFAKVSALLNVAQTAQQDMECVRPDDNDENITCEIFSGEDMECKKALGGVQDCCDQPVGVSVGDYLSMIMAVPKVDAAIMGADLTSSSMLGQAQSGYMSLRNPVTDAVKSVTEPFTSHIDTAVNAIKEPVEKALSELVTQLKDQVASITEAIVGSLGGADAGAAAGQAVAGEIGEEQVGGQLLGFAQTLYGIYAYYALAMAMIKIIWKCEEEEFMLAAQKEFGNCKRVGSYCKSKVLGVCVEKRTSSCCFKSPLARIMQEQVRLQVGKGWGSAKNPSCDGIPLQDLDRIDWDRVNLDEWTAILSENGLYQGAPENLTVEALTGSGNVLGGDQSAGKDRENVFDRTQMRGENIDFDERKSELMQGYPVNNMPQ